MPHSGWAVWEWQAGPCRRQPARRPGAQSGVQAGGARPWRAWVPGLTRTRLAPRKASGRPYKGQNSGNPGNMLPPFMILLLRPASIQQSASNSLWGVVAQMVERPLSMREVGGSIPSDSIAFFAFFTPQFPTSSPAPKLEGKRPGKSARTRTRRHQRGQARFTGAARRGRARGQQAGARRAAPEGNENTQSKREERGRLRVRWPARGSCTSSSGSSCGSSGGACTCPPGSACCPGAAAGAPAGAAAAAAAARRAASCSSAMSARRRCRCLYWS
jgi:hypothetical protein